MVEIGIYFLEIVRDVCGYELNMARDWCQWQLRVFVTFG